MGGDSLNKSFYTGVISTLMWLPNYIKEVSNKLDISNENVDKKIAEFLSNLKADAYLSVLNNNDLIIHTLLHGNNKCNIFVGDIYFSIIVLAFHETDC